MQNNVDISTNEKDLKIVYGMIDYGPERELARASVKYLLTDVNDIRKTYIRLGFHLREFDRLKYYQDFGFSSLSEFCDKNLGMDKSAVSRCISVFEEFAWYQNNIPMMHLDDKYKEYSYSQLCEMVSMKPEQRKLVKPSMTVKQIRELKKVKQDKSVDSIVATSQPDNHLDMQKFSNCYGAARQSVVKSAEPLDSIVLNVFDRSGKPVFLCNNVWVDLLGKTSKEIVVRLTYDVKEDKD